MLKLVHSEFDFVAFAQMPAQFAQRDLPVAVAHRDPVDRDIRPLCNTPYFLGLPVHRCIRGIKRTLCHEVDTIQ